MDTPDPATGLTPREKEAVRNSWKNLSVDWKVQGIEFFGRLMESSEVILSYFKAFDGLDIKQIKASPKLRAHSLNFKLSITSFLDSLDDPECLVDLIQKLARNHFRRNIKDAKLFHDALTLFQNYLQEVQDVDDFTKSSWEKTLGAVHGIIKGQIEKMEKGLDEY